MKQQKHSRKKAATALETTSEETSLKTVISAIKRYCRDPPPISVQDQDQLQNPNSKERSKSIQEEGDAFNFAQLRSGYCRLLETEILLMSPLVDPTCPNCDKNPTLQNTGLNTWQTLTIKKSYCAVIITA